MSLHSSTEPYDLCNGCTVVTCIQWMVIIQWMMVTLAFCKNLWSRTVHQFEFGEMYCILTDIMVLCFGYEGSVEKCQQPAASWLADRRCYWAEELQHTLPPWPWAGTEEHHLLHPVWWKGNFLWISSTLIVMFSESPSSIVKYYIVWIFVNLLGQLLSQNCLDDCLLSLGDSAFSGHEISSLALRKGVVWL